MRHPSQFACQTGEVKKINPMMDVRFYCMTSTVMNLESIIWKSPDRIYMSTSVRLISKKLPIFHEIFTYISCEMCVKLSTVFMFKLRLIVTLVLYKAIDIGK